MLAAALIAAVTCGVHADLTGTLSIADRTEVRARVYQGEAQPGYDLMTTPSLRIDLRGRDVEYWLGYAPSLTMIDMELGLDPLIYQTGSTGMSWLATRHLRLSFGEDASYGSENFSFLTPAAAQGGAPGTAPTTPTIQLLPGAETLLYGSSRTWASMQARASRRVLITLSPSFFDGGGLNEASRDQIPRQTMPRVQLDVAVMVDRRDSLATMMAATDTAFTSRPCDPTTGGDPTAQSLALTPYARCRPHNDLVEASETWRRRLTRVDDLALSVGATGVHARLDPGGDREVVFPTGEASFVHHFRTDEGMHGELTADVRIAPIIDVRFGTLDQRAQGVAGCKWSDARTTLNVGAGFTQSLPITEPQAVTFIGFTGEALYAVGHDKRFEVGGGYRGAWQTQQPFSPFFSNVFYGAIVYHEPALEF